MTGDLTLDVALHYHAWADTFFWLREPCDGGVVDELRREIAGIYVELPRWANIVLDPVVAGGPGLLVDALPEDVDGLPLRRTAGRLASLLAQAPPVPAERRALVEQAISDLDPIELGAATEWVAWRLGLEFPTPTRLAIDVSVVAAGIALGGVTGERDERPACFVAVANYNTSTLAELIIHEATHAVDLLCPSTTSLVHQLREEPGASPQLWHATFFRYAAEAVRRRIDAHHVDYGEMHGYYGRSSGVMATLAARGIRP